jgi:hypothetical protein
MDFFKLNQIMNEQQALHTVERSGVTADERYFIRWKEDRDGEDEVGFGIYGTYKDAEKFRSKEAAEEAVAHIADGDGYNVYAEPLEEPAPQATQHKIEASIGLLQNSRWTDPNERPKRGRLVTKDGIDITDKLPFKTTWRKREVHGLGTIHRGNIFLKGDPIVVVDFEAPHKPSSTGRISIAVRSGPISSFSPSVADLEIVDHDFSEQRAN